MAKKVITPATGLLVSLETVKSHLALLADQTEYDGLLSSLIATAEAAIEDFIDRPVRLQTLLYTLDTFPAYGQSIKIWSTPLSEVESLKYTNSSNVLTTVPSDSYVVSDVGTPAYIYPKSGWPSDLMPRENAVEIQIQAGWSQVPAPITQAALLLIAHYFENREATTPAPLQDIPVGVHFLLNPYRAVTV